MNEINENGETVIKLQNVSKTFGKFVAVENISLEIKRGEIVGFLGPNGAGKSTTMKMLANLLIPDQGSIWIRRNEKLQKLNQKTQDYLLDNLGFLIETPAFYDNVTPRQVLAYFAELKGYPKSKIGERVEETIAMVGLSAWIDKPIGTFSKGMKQRMGILASLVHDPDVIILDEPQTGLDPKARREVREFIKSLKNKGKTVFISSHLLFEISEIADRIAIIYNGKLIALDTLENLEALVKQSYLQIELLETKKDTQKTIKKLQELVGNLTGLENGTNSIQYDSELNVYKIEFDGNPKTQLNIFKKLARNGLDIISMSVPRPNLLEELYLKSISSHGEDRSYTKIRGQRGN